MGKIYIVNAIWNYDGYADDFANTYESHIEKIFDSEAKAIAFIQDKLRSLVERRKAVLAAIASVNRSECRREKCNNCIACEDTIDLDEVPTFEYIKEHNADVQGIVYKEEHQETSSYQYEEHEVY